MPILGNKNKMSIVDQSSSPPISNVRKVKIDNSIRPRQLKDFANAKVYAKMLREQIDGIGEMNDKGYKSRVTL